MMRRSITSLLLAGAIAPAVPATAAAQSTPAPAAPKLSITTEQVTVSGGRASALTGRQWRGGGGGSPPPPPPAAPGRILIRATHFATPQLATLKAKAVGVSIVRPSARPGARGPVVRLLQGQLRRLGYVTGTPGLYDART